MSMTQANTVEEGHKVRGARREAWGARPKRNSRDEYSFAIGNINEYGRPAYGRRNSIYNEDGIDIKEVTVIILTVYSNWNVYFSIK